MKFLKICIIIFNAIICFSFGFGVLAFNKLGKPFVRGFYCNDNNISKPFRENTLSSSLVVAVTFSLTIIIIAIVETRKVTIGINISQYSKALLYNKKNILRNFVVVFVLYLYGAGITTFVTDVGKYSIGRLRPNFFAVCKPDWSKINCTSLTNHDNFIVGDQFCSAEKNSKLKDARLSFPSGHASHSAFVATFHILYIEIGLKPYNISVIVPKVLIQVILGILAFYCGLTRISDNKHHPTDVLAGALIGLFVGVITIFVVVKPIIFKSRTRCIDDNMVNRVDEIQINGSIRNE